MVGSESRAHATALSGDPPADAGLSAQIERHEPSVLAPAHENPKYNAVYLYLCDLAKRGKPCPPTRQLAARVGLTQYIAANAFNALRDVGLIRTSSDYTGEGGRYRIIEIVASGNRTGHPSTELQDLPSDGQSRESAVGPRESSEIATPTPAPEEPITGPPALLSQGFTGWPASNHSLAAERQRLLSKHNGNLSPRVLNTALTSREGCQFPLWGDDAAYGDPDYGTYCGAARCHDDAPYCLEHFQRSYAGTSFQRLGETSAELLKRIERGRKIREGRERAKVRRQHEAVA